MHLAGMLLLVLLFWAISLSAQHKRIYLALDDHTDYMWSGDEATYRNAFLDMLDYYIDRAERTITTEPPQYQSRFSCDGSYWMWTYEKNRPAAQFERLINCIRSGHITVPLTALTICYGGMPAEAVLRSMYYAGSIERRFGLSFPLAVPMEDQTMPYGVGSLWGGAGAKYCWMGICGCASRMNFREKRPHEIYWWEGQDGSRLLTKWHSLHKNGSLGSYAEGRSPYESIDYVVSDEDFRARYPFDIIGIFGKGHDDLMTTSTEFIDVAKNETTENRSVIVSNETDFFEDFEAEYGETLPSFSAAFGNEWDLYPASLTGLSGRVRRSVEKLRSAEALATLVSLCDPDFMNPYTDESETAFLNMGLYWNHDWTADGQIVSDDEYTAWARRTAMDIENYVHTLYENARRRLERLIAGKAGAVRFYAFNPLGWRRTDIADIVYEDEAPVHVIDTRTGLETPSEFLTRGGVRYLRIRAADIPAAGYAVYEIREGAGADFDRFSAAVDGNVIENEFYRIQVAGNGSISSLADKRRGGRELVRKILGRTVNDIGGGDGAIEREHAGSVSATVAIHSGAVLEHTTRITVYAGIDRIDIRNDIMENFSAAGEDVPCWAFGFDLANPDIWHEETGAVIRAKLLADGGHYSPSNARYDWLTLNHFADISDGGGYGVTLSNADCAFMKTGRSSLRELDTETPQVNVLIGGQIDGPKLGIPSQGGDSYFLQRFALKTHDAFSKADAMRFALEHQNPIVTGFITGGNPHLPETAFSLLSVRDPEVLLWALKPHSDGFRGNGMVARFWNMGEAGSGIAVAIPSGRIAGARELTHVETPVRDLLVSGDSIYMKASAFQMKTVGISLERGEKGRQ